jgi:putative ABC transport system permease protein
MLATLGGLLGVGVGAAIIAAAPSAIPPGLLPGAVTLTFGARAVTFAAIAAVVVGVVFGLAPAWQATRVASPHNAAPDDRTTTGAGSTLRSALVISEVATAVLLLVGAGLLLRTLLSLNQVDRGYRAQGALTMVVDPMASTYPSAPALQQFFGAVEEEIRSVPGVKSVAWASTLPLGPSYFGDLAFQVIGAPPVNPEDQPTADFQVVSHTYFETLDLPIVNGRPFTAHDTADSVRVCIVNEAFVRRYLGGRAAVGTQLALRAAGALRAKPTITEIVGVARQIKGRPDEASELLQIYVPMPQALRDDMFVVVRPARGSGEALAGPVRAAIARVDKAQLVSVRDIRTLDNVRSEATARHRFRAVLVVTFAILALLLAIVGVFGTAAYTVQQRRREFGLRMALGATARSVFGLVIGDAVRTIAIGVVIGLALAAASGRVLTSMLFGVEPLDAATFATVTLVLAATALLSVAAPAWRATRVDPARTLRTE